MKNTMLLTLLLCIALIGCTKQEPPKAPEKEIPVKETPKAEEGVPKAVKTEDSTKSVKVEEGKPDVAKVEKTEKAARIKKLIEESNKKTEEEIARVKAAKLKAAEEAAKAKEAAKIEESKVVKATLSGPEGLVEAAVLEFYKEITSQSEVKRKMAYDKLKPDLETAKVLFGSDTDTIWPKIKRYSDELRGRTSRLKKDAARGGNLVSVIVIDIRGDTAKGSYEKMLGYLPKDIGLYKVVVMQQSSTSNLSVYTVKDGRVKHFRGLKSMVKAVLRSKK